MSNRSHRKRRRIVAAGLTLLLLLGPSGRAFAESAAERRLRALEETLRKTQEEVKELHHQIDQQKAATQETQKKVDEAAISARTATADAKKAVSLPDWLGRTTLFGDVRYRHEGFYHQPHAKKAVVTARNRERIRARLGVRVALTDELSATIRGASGNINDPISTNETLSGNFNRKSFNLDWARPGEGARPRVPSRCASGPVQVRVLRGGARLPYRPQVLHRKLRQSVTRGGRWGDVTRRPAVRRGVPPPRPFCYGRAMPIGLDFTARS